MQGTGGAQVRGSGLFNRYLDEEVQEEMEGEKEKEEEEEEEKRGGRKEKEVQQLNLLL